MQKFVQQMFASEKMKTMSEKSLKRLKKATKRFK